MIKQKQHMRPKAAVVIAAGGTGTRMNADVPKQFLEIAGKPILLRTVEAMAPLAAVGPIVIALPAEHIQAAEAILRRLKTQMQVACVAGGQTRQDSVLNAVEHIAPDADVILVHDAVRPLCPPEVMERVLETAWLRGAAVPGLPATDTIQRVSARGCVLATPPRSELFAIQTPQGFHARILRAALARARREGFQGTDESSVVRWAGHRVYVVPGAADNLKITRPLDLEIAERLLDGQSRNGTGATMGISDLRIGQGIDYHRLVEGRKLILGGVDIPFEKGLAGHSDADVLVHAVCDAVLGAAALGDIGKLFPDTDPAHLDRRSLFFLEEVRSRVEAAGWSVRNIDATLLLEKPKIAPYSAAMARNIAAALGMDVVDVSVKATTTEGLNAEGRGEGVSAQAVALLLRR